MYISTCTIELLFPPLFSSFFIIVKIKVVFIFITVCLTLSIIRTTKRSYEFYLSLLCKGVVS
uniref:Uncharacterized protein n=1 Tax=Amphimedon queenslandica TaxID=400682 RepID=A0A1X7UCC6_AMPQE